MSALLSVEDLRVAFTTYGRTVEVLEEVSLEVPAGAQVALVGESGSGKSVTMKAIMGLLPQPPARIHSGRILFDGRDLLTLPERERLRLRGTAMSMVFQDPMSSLNPVWTIGDSSGRSSSMPTGGSGGRGGGPAGGSACSRCWRRSGCANRCAWRGPSPSCCLSGGMRQRVLIAMALLSEPPLLIADEPGTALDVTTQAQILKLLKDLVTEQHLALLMITHNLGVVRETSAFTYVMNQGEIVERGPTAEIFTAPREAYTKALIAAVPRLSGAAA